MANFFAGDPAGRGGVRVAAKEIDGVAGDDLVTGLGAGAPATATTYTASAIRLAGPDEAPGARESFTPFAGLTGINVG